jgi:hypothetical protein
MGLVSMFCSDLGQSFEPPSRCSLVTQSPFYDVYLENIGEVLSKFCLRSEYQGGGISLVYIVLKKDAQFLSSTKLKH